MTPGLVRLSVGLESIDDILADLEQGFAAAAGVTGSDSAWPACRRPVVGPAD